MKVQKAAMIAILTITLVMGSFTMSFGSIYDGGDPTTQENINLTCAYTLYDMGLLQGTVNGFELDKHATRLQGIVMFIRILGQEEAAKAGGTNTTFSDVPSWGKSYTAFAETQGLSKGIGNGKFGSDTIMSARDYATFLLRGLGYDDSKGDFSYTDAIDFFEEIGAITEDERSYLTTAEFKRGEMALMSYRALCANLKGTKTPLAEKLGKGRVVEADHTGMVNGKEHNFRLQFTDFHSLKNATEVYIETIGYKVPPESCFFYQNISKGDRNIFYQTMDDLKNMTYGASSDDGTSGQFMHVIVLCDSTGNELGYMRLNASMENTEKQNEKFIVTPFPDKYKEPAVITDGLNYDKATGTIHLDKEKISAQIGNYSRVYSAVVNYSAVSGLEGYTPSLIIRAMHPVNDLKAYEGDTAAINVDSSKYYQLLLFMDAGGNPVGCKAFDK